MGQQMGGQQGPSAFSPASSKGSHCHNHTQTQTGIARRTLLGLQTWLTPNGEGPLCSPEVSLASLGASVPGTQFIYRALLPCLPARGNPMRSLSLQPLMVGLDAPFDQTQVTS